MEDQLTKTLCQQIYFMFSFQVDNSEHVDGDITNEFDNNLEYENISSAPNDLEVVQLVQT